MASRAPSETWTDEKHFRFLNSVEASFVRTVFGNKNADGGGCGGDDGGLRLDRYLPDSSESTQDLQSQRRKKTTTSSSSSSSDRMGPGPRARSDGRQDRRSRKGSSQSKRDSSHDQVVPQLADIKG